MQETNNGHFPTENNQSVNGFFYSMDNGERVELQFEWMPPCTVGTYELLAIKGGIDVWAVYNHLLYTARLQKTNQVWAKDVYITIGLTMSLKRLKKAKKFLHDHGYINFIRCRDRKTGQLGTTYIRVNFVATRRSTDLNIKKSIYLPTGTQNSDLFDTKREVATIGTITTGVVNHRGGNEQQMLKESKEILKESKQMLKESNDHVIKAENTPRKTVESELIDFLNKEHELNLSTGNHKLDKKIRELVNGAGPDYAKEVLSGIAVSISTAARNKEAVFCTNLDKLNLAEIIMAYKNHNADCPACGRAYSCWNSDGTPVCVRCEEKKPCDVTECNSVTDDDFGDYDETFIEVGTDDEIDSSIPSAPGWNNVEEYAEV